jgi:hypothetical protein
MPKTLFNLTHELARLLGVVAEGVATGGSTTTIADTVERTEADDFWNGGSAWILYDAAGAGAAPEGEYSFVSDFANSGGVVTLRSTLTAAVASGDRYAIAGLRYPLHLLIQKINEVLRTIPIQKDDITTITIAALQTEYSLPADVWALKEVWIQTNVDDTNDTQPQKLYDYHVQKSATGTANKLVLDRQFAAGDILKLVYLTDHATLRVATDKLDDSIHINRVLYDAAVRCLLWYKSKVGDSDTSVNDLLNLYQSMAQEMNNRFRVEYPRRSGRTIHPTFDRP